MVAVNPIFGITIVPWPDPRVSIKLSIVRLTLSLVSGALVVEVVLHYIN